MPQASRTLKTRSSRGLRTGLSTELLATTSFGAFQLWLRMTMINKTGSPTTNMLGQTVKKTLIKLRAQLISLMQHCCRRRELLNAGPKLSELEMLSIIPGAQPMLENPKANSVSSFGGMRSLTTMIRSHRTTRIPTIASCR